MINRTSVTQRVPVDFRPAPQQLPTAYTQANMHYCLQTATPLCVAKQTKTVFLNTTIQMERPGCCHWHPLHWRRLGAAIPASPPPTPSYPPAWVAHGGLCPHQSTIRSDDHSAQQGGRQGVQHVSDLQCWLTVLSRHQT